MHPCRHDTGKSGERLAEKYLVSRGFSILEKNYRTPFGEIDIVAKHKGNIVFLEIKTRISERAGPPLFAITMIKQKHVIQNCRDYLLKHNMSGMPYRIDVIGIQLDQAGKLQVLKHVKNAFGIEALEYRRG